MPKYLTKFNPALQKEFPFLQRVRESETEVLCSLCNAKFSVAREGRGAIQKHIARQKHIKAAGAISSNKPMTDFLSADFAVMELARKELTFAYHSAKHQISGPTVECGSKLINKLFESKFTCGAMKTAKLVQKVSSNAFLKRTLLKIYFLGYFARDRSRNGGVDGETHLHHLTD